MWRGVAVGCRMKHFKGFTVFKGLEGFKGLEVWRVLGLANGRLGCP